MTGAPNGIPHNGIPHNGTPPNGIPPNGTPRNGTAPSAVPGPTTVEPIAVVGMAARVPGAGDVSAFWRNLTQGVESIRFSTRREQAALGVPASRLDDPGFVPAAAALEDAELFDAAFFGLTPREAELRDPQQRLFLELAHTALEDAGYDPARWPGDVGVYGGTGADEYQWKNVRRNPEVFATAGVFAVATANHSSYLSTFTSYALDLRGPSVTVQTACSTSLVAVHLACEGLRAGECDLALAGAASVDVPHGWGYVHAEGGIMSPDGHCRAFDAASAGTVWGSGGGVVVLKRLSDAVADGDTVRAVVLGDAVNNDGADKVAFTAPSVAGQTAVVAQALGLAGVDPRTVTYVEAHGTGTALGDPIEVAALTAAFATGGDPPGPWCGLGSVKTNIGHLSSASGVVGLIKTVLALQHRQLPPSLHFRTPHPSIDFATSPFRVVAELTPWQADAPRRACVSSFGVGGTNAHVVLQEAPPPSVAPAPARPHVLQLSARTPAALDRVADRLGAHLGDHPSLDLADVAFTLRQGRRRQRHRGYLVARSTHDAATGLLGGAAMRTAAASGEPKVAFLFPGQGAQRAGSGAALYRADRRYAADVDTCAGLLRDLLDLDLRDLLLATGAGRADADARLTATALAQPALFTVEYALARWWVRRGVEPSAMIGHSIGEFVAATLADVLTLPDALRLVARRGALMQSAPPGAMLAVRRDEAQLRATLPTGLTVAVVNGPDSCVVAGAAADVEAYATRLERDGVGHARLRTSHAFHSPLMEPVLDAFRADVAAVPLRPPQRPVLSNVTGGWADAGLLTDPEYWVRHLREPVRFGDELATLLEDGDWSLLEVGPGGTLAALARPLLPAFRPPVAGLPDPDPDRPDAETEALLEAAGQLWIHGVPVDLDRESEVGRTTARRVPLPTYPYERRRHWVDPTSDHDLAFAPVPAGPRAVEDWFAVPTWRQLPVAPAAIDPGSTGPSATGPATGTRGPGEAPEILVIGAGPGAQALAVRLQERGPGVQVASAQEAAALLGDARALPARIVHAVAWTSAPTGPDPDAAWAAQGAGLLDVLRLVQTLAAARPQAPVHLDVVTAGTQSVVGGDLTSPEHATLAAAALVLPLELSWLTVRHVDMPGAGPDAGPDAGPGAGPSDADVHRLAAELLAAPADAAGVVALRGGRRWVREWEHVPMPAGADEHRAALRPGAVCLITGGLGGIGITVAEQFAVHEGARLVLLSRTPLPPRALWDGLLAGRGVADRVARAVAAVRRMEAAGAQVLVVRGDVTDVEDLWRVRREVLDRFGRLDVVVHAAGVAGGGMAEVKELAQAEAVLLPKVRGTLALGRVFGDLPLDAVVLCASVTGIAGGFGQVDYCGANAFLDAVAQAGTVFAGRTVSVDWGGWSQVGMAAEVTAPSGFRALQRGVVATPIEDPLLTTLYRDPAGGTARCTGTVGPRTHWVLDEHRLDGRPVLPGTAQLAAIVSAVRAMAGDRSGTACVELTDITLLEPMVVDDAGQAELQVSLSEGADGLDVEVSSRTGGQERVHARGVARVLAGDDAPPASVHDPAAVVARCLLPAPRRNATFSSSGLFRFGPRWASLRRVAVGRTEDIARLEAPGVVAAELDRWPVHPALLDEALSFAAGRTEHHFLPMAYGRVVVRGPLPSTGWSHLRYRDTSSDQLLVADVTVLNDEGREVLTVSDLVLRRIDADAVRAATAGPVAQSPGTTAAPAAAPAAVSRRLPGTTGIWPADGAEVVRRLLAVDVGPQVAVTVQPVRETIAAARSVTQRSLEEGLVGGAPGGLAGEAANATGRDAARDGDRVVVPPASELEAALCRLWQDALGLQPVSTDDDFFAVGGNSLVAVQLLAGIRALTGLRVPMRTLFEAATVAGMAREVERLHSPGTPPDRSAPDAVPAPVPSPDAAPHPDAPPITALPRDTALTVPLARPGDPR